VNAPQPPTPPGAVDPSDQAENSTRPRTASRGSLIFPDRNQASHASDFGRAYQQASMVQPFGDLNLIETLIIGSQGLILACDLSRNRCGKIAKIMGAVSSFYDRITRLAELAQGIALLAPAIVIIIRILRIDGCSTRRMKKSEITDNFFDFLDLNLEILEASA
jgi:hypothetical protein